MNTLPPSTIGEDSVRLEMRRDQRTRPRATSKATRRPGSKTVAYTVPPMTAGADADSDPSRCDHMTLPVCLLVAFSVALSASWKMRSPWMTPGNSSSEPTACAQRRLNGGCTRGGAGKKRVWFLV